MHELQAFDDLLALPDNEFWDLINSSKKLKKDTALATEVANDMLDKLRSVRLNQNQEAE
jgi:antitoxin CptB